jgi:hypothetical protein
MPDGTPPTWVQTITDLIVKVGVPTALAAVLMWFFLARVVAALDTARAWQLDMLKLVERCCPGAGP